MLQQTSSANAQFTTATTRLRAALSCAAVLFIQSASQAAESALVRIKVNLVASRATYVLGEPVLLAVNVTNLTAEAIKAQALGVADCEPELEVHISQDGKVFQRYEMGIYPYGKIKRNVATLMPGEAWTFKLKILYSYRNRNGLAFEAPGMYSVKVVYPLLWLESEKQSPRRLEFISNMIQIRIRPPVGVDAQVWERIKGVDFAYFLQSGEVNLGTGAWEDARKTLTPAEYANGNWVMKREYEKLIPTALSIFESYSKTAYREPLREALLSFYNGCKFAVSEEQANRMRTVLRIKEGLFPDDRRLNTMLEIAFPEMTPLDEVFAYVSKQTGVPLYLDDQFKKGRLKSFPRDKLRRFMTWMSAYKAEWIPEGKGYRLIPKAGEPR